MKNERGFMLLEVVLLSFILVGFSAVMYSYYSSIRMEKMIMAREAALYLAEEEMNYLMDKRDSNELFIGKYDYLGEHELNLNSVDYEITAEVENNANDANFFNAKVTVKWKIFQKERELKVERMILNHALNQ